MNPLSRKLHYKRKPSLLESNRSENRKKVTAFIILIIIGIVLAVCSAFLQFKLFNSVTPSRQYRYVDSINYNDTDGSFINFKRKCIKGKLWFVAKKRNKIEALDVDGLPIKCDCIE